jgi:hypothetical protein
MSVGFTSVQNVNKNLSIRRLSEGHALTSPLFAFDGVAIPFHHLLVVHISCGNQWAHQFLSIHVKSGDFF